MRDAESHETALDYSAQRVSLVVLLVAVVVVNNTVARLPPMPSAEGKYISLRGKEIHYFEQPGQGVPVVMIHGLPGTHEDYRSRNP